MNNTLKGIGAVLAGIAAVVVLSVVTDLIMEKIGIFPPPMSTPMSTGMLVVALVYRSIYTIAGGYITATLAPGNPMRHTRILAIIGTVLGTIGVFVGWNLSQHWYPIALAITAYPLTILGGKIKTKAK